MNNIPKNKPVMPETLTVNRLLNEFSDLVRRQKEERKKTVATKAASAFFEKDILTIVDYFEPIGNDLRIPAKPSKETIGDFIRQNLGIRILPKKTPVTEVVSRISGSLTIKKFFEPLV